MSKESYTESEKIDTEKLMTKYMQIIGNYVEDQEKYIENMPTRFLEIVREYQELLFSQPVTEEEIQ